jgi:ribonuclease-3
MSKNELEISRLKETLGINWHDVGLLHLAMTHSSYSYEYKDKLFNNQRLEFLGDAVLELLVSEHLYLRFPERTEGDLTKMRASAVCEPSLARLARQLNLGRCLFMGKGEERSGGRERPSILADSFESLLGAVYLDGGLEEARRFLLKYIKPLIEDIIKGNLDRDFKTELQELLQKKSGETVHYIILKEDGPDHDKIFTAGVIYEGREMGRGTGHSKKEAEQQAARIALYEKSNF